MNKEIMAALMFYNENNRLVDEVFFKKVYEIVMRDFCFGEELNELILITYDNEENPEYKKYTEGLAGIFGQAAYDYKEKKLVIYVDNMKNMRKKELEDFNFSEDNYVIAYNFLIVQTIFHELEHIKQNIMLKSGEDFESELLRSVHSSSPETTSTYEYSLSERLAEINSYQILIDMYVEMGLDKPDIYNMLVNKLNDRYLNGYHFRDEQGYVTSGVGRFVSPTDMYVERRNCNKVRYNELSNMLEGDDRLKYGFSISLEKYNQYKNGISAGYHM